MAVPSLSQTLPPPSGVSVIRPAPQVTVSNLFLLWLFFRRLLLHNRVHCCGQDRAGQHRRRPIFSETPTSCAQVISRGFLGWVDPFRRRSAVQLKEGLEEDTWRTYPLGEDRRHGHWFGIWPVFRLLHCSGGVEETTGQDEQPQDHRETVWGILESGEKRDRTVEERHYER